jgi:hypothetical protein
MLFLAAIQAAIISHNLGSPLDPMYVVLPAVGILIFYLGTIMPKTRRNWFIGIRTPWTISSDHVWQKTHELGGHLFQVLGIIIVLGVFAPNYAHHHRRWPRCVFVLYLRTRPYCLRYEFKIVGSARLKKHAVSPKGKTASWHTPCIGRVI